MSCELRVFSFKYMGIYEAIKAIAGAGRVVCDSGVAKNVRADEGVCDVEIAGKAPALGVLLGDAKEGVLTVPEEESVVVVVWATPTLAVLVLAAQVAEVRVRGGKLGGLVNIETLTQKLNALVDAFNTHTHPVSGSVTLAPSIPAASFTAGDYEDDKVKH